MPEKLVIEDFSGGRNTRDSQNLIDTNEHQTGSQNIWQEIKSLRKRRGTTAVALPSGLPGTVNILFFSDLGSTTRMIGVGENNSLQFPFITDNGTTFSYLGYNAGTIAVSANGLTVTGTGTAFNTQVLAEDRFKINADGDANWVRISSVDSATQLTLGQAYPGAPIAGGTAYRARKQLTLGFPVSIQQMGGIVYFYHSATPHRYSTTGTEVLNLATSIPAARYALVHKNRMFMARYGTTLSRLAWSDLGDPETFTTANFQDIKPADGGDIRGIVEYGGYIVIFKRKGMFKLVGDIFSAANPDYILEEIPVPPDFNFVYGRTAVTFQGYLVFLTDDGWFRYPSPTGGIEKFSDKIQPDVDGLRSFGIANAAMVDNANAWVWKNRLWVSVPTDTGGGTLDEFLVLDENWKWWLWTRPTNQSTVSSFATAKFGTATVMSLYGGSPNTNNLLTLDTGNSDVTTLNAASAINGLWISREWTFDSEIEFLYIDVWMLKQSAGSLIIGYDLDRVGFVNTSVSMTAGQGTVIRERVAIARTGKAIRIQLQNNTSAQTFEVYKVEIAYEPTEAMRV